MFALPDWSDVPGAYGRALDAVLTAARTGVPDPCGAEFGARLTEILAQAEAELGPAV